MLRASHLCTLVCANKNNTKYKPSSKLFLQDTRMYHDSTETDEDQEAIDPALAGVVFNLAYTIHSRVFFQ